MDNVEHTSRNVDSNIGPLRVYLYITSELPMHGLLTASVCDLNARRGEIEHCAVNRIGVSFSRYLRADVNADLTNPDSWRLGDCTTSRIDTLGYNDATESQKLKVSAAAKQAVTSLFSDPNFLYQVLADNEAVEREQVRKEVRKLEAELAKKRAILATRMARHDDMLDYLKPAVGLDLANRMVDEDERARVFGLGGYTGRDYISRNANGACCPITNDPVSLTVCREVPCPHLKEMLDGKVQFCRHPEWKGPVAWEPTDDDEPRSEDFEDLLAEDGIEQPPTSEQTHEACALCELRRTDECNPTCPHNRSE